MHSFGMVVGLLVLAACHPTQKVQVVDDPNSGFVTLDMGTTKPFDIIPVCKSGWKDDATVPRRPGPGVALYVPYAYSWRAAEDGPLQFRIYTPDGHLFATIRRGQSRTWDCFDIPVKDTI